MNTDLFSLVDGSPQTSSEEENLNEEKLNDWTFHKAATRDLTHCYHDYPARMIPQIARRLIDLFGDGANTLFDPYCGTGTSLVEGRIKGINVIGTDLNPLARLITTGKLSVVNLEKLDNNLEKWHSFVREMPSLPNNPIIENPIIEGIGRLDFWFKPDVIEKLTTIREFIERIDSAPVRCFFQIAFSETVRECSNTRNNEFKLYRYSETQLDTFQPDVFHVMQSKLARNQVGLISFINRLKVLPHLPSAQVFEFDTVEGIPAAALPPHSVDIVITSPPYGDSHTTVAYGQYSRLSSAWLGLSEPQKVDRRLMGGKTTKSIQSTQSGATNNAIEKIRTIDEKRAHEVAAFHQDLEASMFHVAGIIRPKGYACYVVGNRKVKGIVLPTNDAVRCAFESRGFSHVETFVRSIPNKRMPSKNSPSNAAGVVDVTMTNEYIVVMQKR